MATNVAHVRRMDTLWQGRTGDAASRKTTQDNPSIRLKQNHQMDILLGAFCSSAHFAWYGRHCADRAISFHSKPSS
jgi:hypothetical protein